MLWAIVPAAGKGLRFGGGTPKQYLDLGGRPLLQHSLEALAGHPRVDGLMVALAAADRHWPGWDALCGKPVLTCAGAADRAGSVLAALHALPDRVGDNDWVLVHDAARPCLRHADLDRLLERGSAHAVGAILAAPVRDTIKRARSDGSIEATEPRDRLWRALTPQLFRRGLLTRALQQAAAAGAVVTDEASAVEYAGLAPLLVEGAADNIKITDPEDLALAEFVLGRIGERSR